jgi:hypothetical protein
MLATYLIKKQNKLSGKYSSKNKLPSYHKKRKINRKIKTTKLQCTGGRSANANHSLSARGGA